MRLPRFSKKWKKTMKHFYRSIGIVAFIISIPMMLIYYTKILHCCSYLSVSPLAAAKTPNRRFEKWIVITTINYPTDSVKALATQTGWRVVIVADKKTPSDWNLIGCDFLSIEKQKQLNFAVSSLIPNNSYTKKMIGYLYAIQNGAKYIYDTDDDNQPIDAGIGLFDTQASTTGLSYGSECYHNCNITQPLFNAYAFWGQPEIWPRGYPLEDVRKVNNEKIVTLCKEQKVPAIQQGLVLKDPDVDAVYRLLNADEATGLNVNFSKHAPPIILNAGTFCPFNSQNTLFHYDAFWSLFLPISVAFRVTDIWRGYFAQKLLHLTGNRLGFYPVNAIQKRNPHSYLADFKDETQLYLEAGKMVEFISKWTCEHNLFQDCMRKLSRDFLANKFWNELDVALIKAWITDLETVGFIFPSLLNFNNEDSSEMRFNSASNCRNVGLHFPVDGSRSAQIRQSFDDFKEWCNEALPANETINSGYNEKKHLEKGVWKNLSRIALIVSGNYPFGPAVSILQRLYGNHFATLIFCGTIKPSLIANYKGFLPVLDYNYINVTQEEINRGYRAYICTAKAIELRLQNIDGYMTIADDAQYNFWNDFDYSRFRLHGSGWTKNGNQWWHDKNIGKNAVEKAADMIRNRTQLNPRSPLAKAFAAYTKAVGGDGLTVIRGENVWSVSDFYYLPKENETVFYEISEVFFEAKVFHEIAVPKIGAGLQWQKYYNSSERDFNSRAHLWNQDRKNWEKFYAKNLTYLHPIKLSHVKDLGERRKYCNFVIQSYFSSLSNEPPTKTTKTTKTVKTTKTTTTKKTTKIMATKPTTKSVKRSSNSTLPTKKPTVVQNTTASSKSPSISTSKQPKPSQPPQY